VEAGGSCRDFAAVSGWPSTRRAPGIRAGQPHHRARHAAACGVFHGAGPAPQAGGRSSVVGDSAAHRGRHRTGEIRRKLPELSGKVGGAGALRAALPSEPTTEPVGGRCDDWRGTILSPDMCPPLESAPFVGMIFSGGVSPRPPTSGRETRWNTIRNRTRNVLALRSFGTSGNLRLPLSHFIRALASRVNWFADTSVAS